ncbi:hypothetical protein KFE94_12660 [bacterium SCSIO 12643]|nr:hypothetical protein KFE94_12660 [bacterium SCSIO 12643]
MKIRYLFIILILSASISSCTPSVLVCYLKFSDYKKTYDFNFSKTELKNRIVEAYTYDKSLLLKNFGLTLIEEETVNSEYRKSVEVWLDKGDWDDVKSEIRNNTSDTLNLLIGKHHSRKQIQLLAIIAGDSTMSSLTIMNIEYQRKRACENEKMYHKLKISNQIDQKLIKKLE